MTGKRKEVIFLLISKFHDNPGHFLKLFKSPEHSRTFQDRGHPDKVKITSEPFLNFLKFLN